MVRFEFTAAGSAAVDSMMDDGPRSFHTVHTFHLVQELVDRAQGGSSRWEDIYDEVAAKEMEIFNALADGSALEQVRGLVWGGSRPLKKKMETLNTLAGGSALEQVCQAGEWDRIRGHY